MKHHIKELYDLVMNLPVEKQLAFIDASEYSDETKEKVKRLINVDVSQVDITNSIIDSVHIGLEIKPIEAGMQIESYELIRPIGQGGQGEVWLAQRTEGDFNHQVAIKFLKPVHDQKELQRFRNERELLAQLKHNNIAQLIGGGELLSDSKKPRPYMILELVEGLPLLEYCKQQKYNLRQYLVIFLQICDAISYAHSHLVVHRDIKPGNIIVTENGVVKLLDFGIAKLLQSKQLDTQTVPIMTLAYSSPEQVSGAPISTATDIYILGLLLYEMLTGQRAQAVTTEVPTELIHEITEKIPTSPSQVKVLPKLNRNYSSRHLKGDLDNLIMMAIRKEPNRRYGTVSALANDVKSYLDRKPLMATGDSRWYKLRKLVSRNPTVTILSTTVLCFLIILPVVMYNSQQQLSQQRDLEIAARKVAQQQSIIANRTKDFLINILKSASPLGNKGEEISLNDVLIQSERQLQHGLNDQPIIKAELINTLSSIHHHLGDSKKAIEFYKKSLPIYEQNDDISGQVFTLGQMAVISIIDNDPVGAGKYAEHADNLSEQLTDPVEIAWHHSRMATWQGSMGQDERAHETLLQSLQVLEQEQIGDHELLGRIYNELMVTSPDNQQALEYIDKALYHGEKDHGKIHPKYFSRLINKATRLNRLGQVDVAESTFLQAQEIGNKLYNSKHPSMASLYGELAFIYQDTGRFETAKKYFETAMSIDKEMRGVESLSYALRTNNLGYLYEDMGDYQQAEQLFRESLDLRERYFSADPIRVAGTKFNLARLLAKTGRHDESERLVNEVIPVYQAKKKKLLSVEIVQLANQLGSKPSSPTCQSAETEVIRLKTAVEKISEKSWLRMYHELWLGQLAHKCDLNEMAKQLLLAAQNRATDIYNPDSEGLKRIQLMVEIAIQ
jgi:serine/threonine protein kinase/Flp pilus assembly protein TadD